MARRPITIPEYDQPRGAAPLPNLRQDGKVLDFTVVGEGLNKLATGLSARQETTDDADALNAYALAQQDWAKIRYDPENGVFARKGAAALDVEHYAERNAKDISERWSQGLSTSAKEKFAKMWTRSLIQDRESISRHVLKEVDTYKANTATAVIDTAISTGIVGMDEPGGLERAKSEIMGAVLFQHKGASREVQRAALDQAFSKLHSSVITHKAPNNAFEAAEYLKQNKGEMIASDYMTAVRTLRPHLDAARIDDLATRTIDGAAPSTELYRHSFPEIYGGAGGGAVPGTDTPSPSPRAGVPSTTRATPGRKGRLAPETVYSLIPPNAIPEGHTRAAFMAMIKQESGFNPNDVTYNPHLDNPNSWQMRSKDGSPGGGTVVGLTQVMVHNARTISRELGDGLMKDKSTAEIIETLKDPAINLRYGAHQFSKSLKRFNGDIEATLVHYNSGRGEQFLKAGRDYRVIPHGKKLYGGMTAREQTMDYVNKVMRNYGASLASGSFPKTSATFTGFVPREELAAIDSRVAPYVKGPGISVRSVKTEKVAVAGFEQQAADGPRTIASKEDTEGMSEAHMPINDLEPDVKQGLDGIIIDLPKGSEKKGQFVVDEATGPTAVKVEGDEDFIARVAELAGKSGMTFDPETRVLSRTAMGETEDAIVKDPREGDFASPVPTSHPTVRADSSLEAQIERAKEITNPRDRTEVIKALRARHELVLKAEREQLNGIKSDLWKKALKGEPISREEYEAVGLEYSNALQKYAETKAAGRKPTTDYATWTKLQFMSDEQLAKLDPFVHRNELSDKHFEELTKMIKAARGDGSSGVKAETSATGSILERTARSLGVKDNAEVYQKLGRSFDAEIDAFVTREKKNPTATQKQEIMDRLTTQVIDAGWMWNSSTPVYQIKRGEKVEVDDIKMEATQIPRSVHVAMDTAFKTSFKRAVSEDQSKQIYGAYLVAQQGGVPKAPKWFEDQVKKMDPEANVDQAYVDWVLRAVGGSR
jgi:hypothetical protein